MDFKKERKRLEVIKNENFSQYPEELKKPWPGMEADLNLVLVMVEEEQRIKGRDFVRFIEDCHFVGDWAAITFPDWMMSAREEFRIEFGHEEGDLRFEKSIAVFFERLSPTYH